jgi:hypothetical protein
MSREHVHPGGSLPSDALSVSGADGQSENGHAERLKAADPPA